jgi:hypothetical protein
VWARTSKPNSTRAILEQELAAEEFAVYRAERWPGHSLP